MEPLTDKLSTLPLPVVVSILALLTAVRVSWKGDRSAVFRVLTEILEKGIDEIVMRMPGATK